MLDRKDWSQEKVKAQLILRGTSLQEISLKAGKSRGAASKALKTRWPFMQKKIAEALNVAPQEIWPSVFDGQGNVRPTMGREQAKSQQESTHVPS